MADDAWQTAQVIAVSIISKEFSRISPWPD